MTKLKLQSYCQGIPVRHLERRHEHVHGIPHRMVTTWAWKCVCTCEHIHSPWWCQRAYLKNAITHAQVLTGLSRKRQSILMLRIKSSKAVGTPTLQSSSFTDSDRPSWNWECKIGLFHLVSALHSWQSDAYCSTGLWLCRRLLNMVSTIWWWKGSAYNWDMLQRESMIAKAGSRCFRRWWAQA